MLFSKKKMERMEIEVFIKIVIIDITRSRSNNTKTLIGKIEKLDLFIN